MTAIDRVDSEPHVYVEGEREETALDAIRHCDSGETVGVFGVHRLAGRWTAIARLVEAMRERDVRLASIEDGGYIDLTTVAAVYRAKRISNGIASMPSSEIARERGAMRGKTDIWKTMTVEQQHEAQAAWLSDITAAQAAAMVGVSRETMYRWKSLGYLPERRTKQYK